MTLDTRGPTLDSVPCTVYMGPLRLEAGAQGRGHRRLRARSSVCPKPCAIRADSRVAFAENRILYAAGRGTHGGNSGVHGSNAGMHSLDTVVHHSTPDIRSMVSKLMLLLQHSSQRWSG